MYANEENKPRELMFQISRIDFFLMKINIIFIYYVNKIIFNYIFYIHLTSKGIWLCDTWSRDIQQ